MIYGSVCSGIEAATMAWHKLGWKPAFFSEIEKVPRQILKHHYPNVPLHGDFTTITEHDYEKIDVLVGGTPCQSFSIAGLREGLNCPRGNLMLEFGRLAQRLQPKYIVWENVPGVLSSNGGRDFRAFLATMGQCGYGFAYRILDAQYVRTQWHPRAVPQRRRRVFVVGGIGRDWKRAAAILFDYESMSGNPPPRRGTGEKAAKCLTRGVGTRYDFETEDFVVSLAGNTIGRQPLNGGNGNGFDESGACYALTSADRHGVAMACNANTSVSQGLSTSDMPPTLCCTKTPAFYRDISVRRLTPLECLRLQGFDDDFLNVPGISDSGWYKAIGNSMAVNCMEWIGQRIEMVEEVFSQFED